MESILKVLNVALVASLAAASIGCVIDVEGFEATEEDQRVFSVSGTPDVTLSKGVIELRTNDGRVRVGVTRDSAMAADWDIETNDGRVTLALPAGFSADLDARTQDGRVLVDDAFGGGAGAEGTLR